MDELRFFAKAIFCFADAIIPSCEICGNWSFVVLYGVTKYSVAVGVTLHQWMHKTRVTSRLLENVRHRSLTRQSGKQQTGIHI